MMAELPPRRARSSALRQLWNEASDTNSESDSSSDSDSDIDDANDQSENENVLTDIQAVHAAGDAVQTDDSSDSEEDNAFIDKNGGRWQLLQKNSELRGRRTQADRLLAQRERHIEQVLVIHGVYFSQWRWRKKLLNIQDLKHKVQALIFNSILLAWKHILRFVTFEELVVTKKSQLTYCGLKMHRHSIMLR